MSAITVDVTAYAKAVRDALAGLGPEQVDDLTDGLEADLAEALADQERPLAGHTAEEVFGAAETYAAELLLAAGVELPPTKPGRWNRVIVPVRELRASGRRVLEELRRSWWWPPIEALFTALRPAWWLVRGWVLWQVLIRTLGLDELWPREPFGLVTLIALLLGSTQWGRGQWRKQPLLQIPGWFAAVVAVLAFVPLVDVLMYRAAETESTIDDGVVVEGAFARNLFVYDSEGLPVPNAQVFDQDGNPVTLGMVVYETEAFGDEFYMNHPSTGGEEWNLYPLVGIPESINGLAGKDPRVVWPYPVVEPIHPVYTVPVPETPSPTPVPTAG